MNPNNKTFRVLIIEDEFLNSYIIQSILEQNGFEVIGICTDGEDAIKIALSSQPDLIIMDICLNGEINGIEAARIILDQINTRVIFLTANLDPATRETAVKLKPAAYISKPITDEELIKAVQSAITTETGSTRLNKTE